MAYRHLVLMQSRQQIPGGAMPSCMDVSNHWTGKWTGMDYGMDYGMDDGMDYGLQQRHHFTLCSTFSSPSNSVRPQRSLL